MARRLRVLLTDTEYRDVECAARCRHMSVAEWVRQALAQARERGPVGTVGRKLEVIRTAARFNYPTADIEQMLAEIESGHGAGEEL